MTKVKDKIQTGFCLEKGGKKVKMGLVVYHVHDPTPCFFFFPRASLKKTQTFLSHSVLINSETYTPSFKMLNKDRLKARQSDFKKGIDLEESKKKREEITVSIRKKNKQEQVNKRRNIQLPTFQGVDPRPADPAALETVSKNWSNLIASWLPPKNSFDNT